MKQEPGISRRRFLRASLAASAGGSLLAQQQTQAVGSFLRSPNIQNLSASGVGIVWTMPTAAIGSVALRDPAGNLTSHPASMVEFTPAVTGLTQTYYQYSASIGGLLPGTGYTYQVNANGLAVPPIVATPGEFQTPGGGAFSFLQFADSGEGNPQELGLCSQMAAEPACLAIANGDLAYDLATYASIEANYYSVYQEMMAQIPFFGSLGNHEYYTDNGSPSLAARMTPTTGVPASDWGRYYSFDWGNAHFVALDSNQPLDDAIAGTGQMLAWLDKDLQNTSKFWRIVFFHHPGYATGKHQDEPPAGNVRQAIVPILEKYGVQLVLNGHEHTYQRTYELLGGEIVPPNSGGIVYITSGGGGADTYYTAPDALIATSIGINNYVFAEVDGAEIIVRVRGLAQNGDIDSTILAPKPQIFSTNSGLTTGGVVTVTGRNLSPSAVVVGSRGPLDHRRGCSANLNGTALSIISADALQMTFQLPAGFTGSGTLMVITPNGSAQTSISVCA